MSQETTTAMTPSNSGADQMADRIRAASLDKLVAAIPAVTDKALRETLPHRYTPELAAQIAETTIGILTGALCPVWPTLCADPDAGHLDHFNHEHFVTDKRGKRMLDVSFVQLSDEQADGPAKISIGGMGSEDYDPSEVHEKTTEIRRLLDQADEMADQVMRMQGKDVPTPSDRAFSVALDRVDAALAASKHLDRTRDALRTFIDMTVDEARS